MRQNYFLSKRYTKTVASIVSSVLAVSMLVVLPGCSKAQDAPVLEPAVAPTVAVQAAPALVTGLPDFTQLVEKVSPAVVNIRTSERVAVRRAADLRQHPICQAWPDLPICGSLNEAPSAAPSAQKERVVGEGSGFIYTQDGYILTNHHVIAGASSILVTMADKREFQAKLIGSDEKTDVAVLKIEASGLPFLNAADSSQLKVGQWVIAAGSPFGLQNTITKGIISAINRDTGDYQAFIQTDAAVNKGNSGGPLVDIYGNVVGINSQILSSSGAFAGVALSIPINDAMQVANQLREKGHVTRGYIGVSIRNVTPEIAKQLGLIHSEGVLIAGVSANGAAATSGMQTGDLVFAVNGSPIKDSRDFARLVGNTPQGGVLTIELERQARNWTVQVVVGGESDAK